MDQVDSNRGGASVAPERDGLGLPMIWSLLISGALLAALIGTWLVWFSLTTQRKMAEAEIRAACQRVMPETADRCFDTVVLQRGGVRR